MITAPTPADSMTADLQRLVGQLGDVARTLAHLGDAVAVQTASPEEQWVRLHGEAVSQKRAGELIGRASRTVASMAVDGLVDKTPDGNILVRSLARWANSQTLRETRRTSLSIDERGSAPPCTPNQRTSPAPRTDRS